VREVGCRRLRHRLRPLHQRDHPRAQHVAADVDEQQQARDREEQHQQQHRHEADEHVAERELAPHAPQQPALGVHVGAVAEDDDRDDEQRARDRVQAAERAHRLGGGAHRPHDRLDAERQQQQPAGDGAREPQPRAAGELAGSSPALRRTRPDRAAVIAPQLLSEYARPS
jgi:hypothetical protein